jgi:subtilisin family serine protease
MRTQPSDQSSRRQTDKWIEGFQNLLVIHDIGARTGPDVIKVAIIDSGIDYNHPEVNQTRIGGWESWIENSDARVDKVGHGTHIAGIILQLTTNVELYIGKVTDTKKFKRRDLITKVRVS